MADSFYKNKKMRVLLADDFRSERDLFGKILTGSGEYEVVSVSSADEAVEYCMTHPVDLAVIDVMMPRGMDGIAAGAQIKQRHPKIKLLMITSSSEDRMLERSRAAGAESFWFKNYSREAFIEIVDRTCAGESIYPDVIPDATIGNAKRSDFSKTELVILREMMKGRTNDEIGKKLGITADGVRYHIKNMLKKTGLPNRVALMVSAARFGIVVNDD